MYRPGDYNVICDKCGMKRKASECRLDWQNLFVCRGCFDIRNPQDFVVGIPDIQTVEIARPDIVSSMGSTTVKTAGSIHSTTIDLTSTSGVYDGHVIGIVLDDGTCFWTKLYGDPSGYTVTFIDGTFLPGPASAGNTVYLQNISSETYITATMLTATGL
jgi:hypothetical protein